MRAAAGRSRSQGHHYALLHCAGPAARQHRALRGAARRRDGLARGRTASSRRASSAPTAASEGAKTRILFGSCRVAAPHEPPHSLKKDEHPEGREVDSLMRDRAADGRARPRGVAARAAAAGRPGLRRRGLAGREGVHPLAPRPRGPAVRDGRRLRGVHAALPRVVGRADDALAALHRALGDDLRRPRRPRRLEHVDRLGPDDARHRLVGPPHRGRLHLVPDLPALGEPLARASWPRTRCSSSPRTRRTSTSPRS